MYFMNYSAVKNVFVENHGLLSQIYTVPYSVKATIKTMLNANGQGLYAGLIVVP